jgi:hypothetical protein
MGPANNNKSTKEVIKAAPSTPQKSTTFVKRTIGSIASPKKEGSQTVIVQNAIKHNVSGAVISLALLGVVCGLNSMTSGNPNGYIASNVPLHEGEPFPASGNTAVQNLVPSKLRIRFF